MEDALEELYRRRYVGFRNALATVTGSYDTARDAVQGPDGVLFERFEL